MRNRTAWTTWVRTGEHIVDALAQQFACALQLAQSTLRASEQHLRPHPSGTVDTDGMALAPIQGLNLKLQAENAELRAQLETLAARVERIERFG